MPVDWDRHLAEWSMAGVIDVDTADRIRAFERGQAMARRTRWSVWLALLFGVVLLAAGVLLLVSASWGQVSPLTRLAIVVAMVAFFHLAAALVWGWSPRIAAALHLAGSVTLGPAIFLAGQVLNLDGHWPAAVMLWGLGALAAWLVRRDTLHLALVAVLPPAWLLSEWAALGELHDLRASIVGQAGAFLLALAYLTARSSRSSAPHARDGRGADLLAGGITPRQALSWLGLLAFLPAALVLGVQAGIRLGPNPWYAALPPLPPVAPAAAATAWTATIVIPLAVAVLLRGRGAWGNSAAAASVAVLALLPAGEGRLAFYAWLALGSMGLAAWGIREVATDRINLATLCFGLVVLFFYFDNLMDKMGRSASLIALGLLFLVGGHVLERARRRMVARAGGGVS